MDAPLGGEAAIDIAQRRQIDERLISPARVSDDLYAEQLESLEGFVPDSELMQIKAHRLMHMLQAAPWAAAYE